jgi:Fe-S-cluster containining protein
MDGAMNLVRQSGSVDPRQVMRTFRLGANAFFEMLVEQVKQTKPLACAKGCIHCCAIPPETDTWEVDLIIGTLIAAWTKDKRANWLSRAKRVQRKRKQMPHRPVFCPFLEEGACSIYAVRPLACAAHHSLDVEACKHALTPDNFTVPAASTRLSVFPLAAKAIREQALALCPQIYGKRPQESGDMLDMLIDRFEQHGDAIEQAAADLAHKHRAETASD